MQYIPNPTRVFFSLLFGLVCIHFFLGKATAAALKSEAAIDRNRTAVTNRVASFPTGLGNGEAKKYAARASVLPRCGTSTVSLVLLQFSPYCVISSSLRLSLLSFLLRVDSSDSHSLAQVLRGT